MPKDPFPRKDSLWFRLHPGQRVPEDWTPQEKYLYQHHLNNLRMGGYRQHGEVSTIFNITQEVDGRNYVLPTIWNAQLLKPKQAVECARQIGIENFPSYNTPQEADARYLNVLHPLMVEDMRSIPHGRQR